VGRDSKVDRSSIPEGVVCFERKSLFVEERGMAKNPALLLFFFLPFFYHPSIGREFYCV
jgi:hypothetical protein